MRKGTNHNFLVVPLPPQVTSDMIQPAGAVDRPYEHENPILICWKDVSSKTQLVSMFQLTCNFGACPNFHLHDMVAL